MEEKKGREKMGSDRKGRKNKGKERQVGENRWAKRSLAGTGRFGLSPGSELNEVCWCEPSHTGPRDTNPGLLKDSVGKLCFFLPSSVFSSSSKLFLALIY